MSFSAVTLAVLVGFGLRFGFCPRFGLFLSRFFDVFLAALLLPFVVPFDGVASTVSKTLAFFSVAYFSALSPETPRVSRIGAPSPLHMRSIYRVV